MQKKAHLTLKLTKADTSQVKKGDRVIPGTELVSFGGDEIDSFDLAKLLGIPAKEVKKYLVIQPGTSVSEGAIIARKGGLMKKQVVSSPLEGTFLILDEEKGIVGIQKKKDKETVTSWFTGTVTDLTDEKIVFELEGHTIAGTSGKGKPVSGSLLFVEETIDMLTMPIDLENKVLAVRKIHADMVAKADTLGVTAVIAQEITVPPLELPYVLVEEIAILKPHQEKTVIVYGDEKQLLVVEGHKKPAK